MIIEITKKYICIFSPVSESGKRKLNFSSPCDHVHNDILSCSSCNLLVGSVIAKVFLCFHIWVFNAALLRFSFLVEYCLAKTPHVHGARSSVIFRALTKRPILTSIYWWCLIETLSCLSIFWARIWYFTFSSWKAMLSTLSTVHKQWPKIRRQELKKINAF